MVSYSAKQLISSIKFSFLLSKNYQIIQSQLLVQFSAEQKFAGYSHRCYTIVFWMVSYTAKQNFLQILSSNLLCLVKQLYEIGPRYQSSKHPSCILGSTFKVLCGQPYICINNKHNMHLAHLPIWTTDQHFNSNAPLCQPFWPSFNMLLLLCIISNLYMHFGIPFNFQSGSTPILLLPIFKMYFTHI